ncbi:helix-turn-helix transcriptional regulator [Actinoplanes sp. TBRC 11911]|uniref:TetR/AcrR family transcriptional regulator n=1 Tax=Actinoplanes sp. TBRC 11911 TaxID=2729386 RepID=UPI00145D11C0|nr:TetR/AcrR family transcriptional regulator [Actinoplanes sp. TBRC 11911]NMO53805.1 helix-turn-helix transcriptional regulator [Actinoplanes sp. TBRC 11911]
MTEQDARDALSGRQVEAGHDGGREADALDGGPAQVAFHGGRAESAPGGRRAEDAFHGQRPPVAFHGRQAEPVLGGGRAEDTFHGERPPAAFHGQRAPAALDGRRAQAARNDGTILAAARAVFIAEPDAPVGAVARVAGVGISALYRRYPSKEALLATLCLDGLRQFVGIAQAAADVSDPWEGFVEFMRGVVDADVHSLTVQLAGRFSPTPEHRALAAEAGSLGEGILRRAQQAGAVRGDIVSNDLPMIYEQLAAIRLGDAGHIRELRRRYLDIHLAGLRSAASSYGPLTGNAPTPSELGARWTRTT